MSKQQSFVEKIKSDQIKYNAIAEELRREIERLEEAFEYHRIESERKSKEIERLVSEKNRIIKNVQSNGANNKKNLKAFNTLLKLVGGMAVAIYGFNGEDKRSETVSQIQNDLDLKGINLDADTIRKWLRESVKLLRAEEIFEPRSK